MPSSSELVETSARSSPALSCASEHLTPLPRQRAVVRQRDFLAGERVHARGHPLGLAAIVHEDQRRARAANALEHERRNRRPDRAVDVREVIHG